MTRRHPLISARRRTATATAAIAGALALGLAGCGSGGPELKVSDGYVPQPAMDSMAGGFLTVKNTGDEADKLTSVSSPLAKQVQMHRTKGGRMEPVKSLTVPANGELKLDRGGNHLMLHDLKRKPVKGDKVSLTLHFEKSDPVKVTVPVEAANFAPGQGK
ncbi:copper chaperone PCu(A)C [Streptomyces sp. ODS28]|uniref:copper chaperone PCu(A)C n=1 Tax=Streptomyces sp. ODS28 TaxID=3136688 RepID=UPI0031EC47CD